VKRRPLRLPATLAVALLGTGGVIASTTMSCGTDEMPTCNIYCFEGITDAGVPPDGGCPLCADLTSGAPTCPSGCTPLG
jgi:hypothetical protein